MMKPVEIVVDRIGRFDTEQDDCAGISVADADNMGFQLSIPRRMARQIILFLASEVARLEAPLPEDERTDGQVIPVIDCQTAVSGDQSVLLLHLESGAVIPLALDSDALASLSAELALQGATASQLPN